MHDAAKLKLENQANPNNDDLLEAVPITAKMKQWHASIHWRDDPGSMSFSLLPYIEPMAMSPQPHYQLPAVARYCRDHGIERMVDNANFTSDDTVELHPVQPADMARALEVRAQVEAAFDQMNQYNAGTIGTFVPAML